MNIFSARFLLAVSTFIFALLYSSSSAAGTKSVAVGQSVTISVSADGTQPFTYQWYKNGAAISGAASATYLIASATSGDVATYRARVTNAMGFTDSDDAVLTVTGAQPEVPQITTQPIAKSVTVGQSVSFGVAAIGTGTLNYQWQKNGSNISGATSAIYTIPSATFSQAGSYSVVVSNANASTPSSSVALAVTQDSAAFLPDGAATVVTGGSAGSTVTATTAANFKSYAESTTPYIINVSGTLSLSGPVSVKSNKTIQGVNGSSTITGSLDLSSGGVNNVIIRGLNITNPTGTGIIVRNATNVFITHCTLFDCSGDLVEISTGSDGVTVSWSEFYYSSGYNGSRSSMRIGLPGVETKPVRVTLHHNWWSNRCDTNMPTGVYGYVHFYNNYFNAIGNTAAANASNNSQFLVERNVFEQMKDPLFKQNGGLIRAILNSVTSCTGKAADAGVDTVLTPSYSYELLPAEDVAIYSTQFAGNTTGATSATPSARAASISGPSAAVVPGGSFTLTAVPSSFSGASYQWRLNNFDISGATSSIYSVTSMQTAKVGTYSVVIGTASGDYVVSSPLAVTLGSATGSDAGSSSGGGTTASAATAGGGGAPGVGFLAALLVMSALRQTLRRNAKKS